MALPGIAYSVSPGQILLGGSLSVGTTAQALSSSQACRYVLVQADPNNTSNLLVGHSNAQPIVLEPGRSLSISIGDVSLIYVRAESGTVTVNWLAYL
ncbi:MAG: hypothetical protein QXI19_15175 [Candidatus Caldarchaeum sp.]